MRTNKIEHEVESQLYSTFEKFHLILDKTKKPLRNIYIKWIKKNLVWKFYKNQVLDSLKIDPQYFCLSKLLILGRK
ncbi:unnamed protein product [Paramecium octaurelia]|uniref:Uncharacterized protein n=1 Tax=Paramecium octaurelia TaxID=43137 RepID=A0A8S1XES9_PAROT|nr:unnamed protein product [Paramecium octaurelia]